jgi:hypothetical protein
VRTSRRRSPQGGQQRRDINGPHGHRDAGGAQTIERSAGDNHRVRRGLWIVRAKDVLGELPDAIDVSAVARGRGDVDVIGVGVCGRCGHGDIGRRREQEKRDGGQRAKHLLPPRNHTYS